MYIYNLGKAVEKLTENDVKNVIEAYKSLGLSCMSNLYHMLSLDNIKKQSTSYSYGLSYEVTPNPGHADNKLIFTLRGGNSAIHVVPNQNGLDISEEQFQTIFDQYCK